MEIVFSLNWYVANQFFFLLRCSAMKVRLYKFLAVAILLIVIKQRRVTCEDAVEFLEMAREKVRFLERTGQIRRDYTPYIERELIDEESYDFIIVGAGSAGSALVHRLSEITKWKILLLEAGGEPDILSEIPYYSIQTHYTDLNWRFYAEPEEDFALGIKNQQLHLPRGKGLGGSSLLNYMIYTRGAREDYDRWAAMGNPGWSYEELLPVFQRLENCSVNYRDEIYRGYYGPISSSDSYITKSGKAFIEAAENSGYRYVDYNGRSHLGVSRIQANHKRGLRCSGELCYIRPIKYRRNLTIHLQSHVTKVLIADNTAYGVEFFKQGRLYKAYANKEVILSAGVFNSPHILLLSGIGPRKQLRKFGIKLVKDLPVGQKMLDHPGYYGLGFTVNDSIVFDEDDAQKSKWIVKLYDEAEGLLTSQGTTEGILFTTTAASVDSTTDIELFFLSSHISTNRDGILFGVIGVDDETYDYTYKPYEGRYAISCVVMLLHPESYGRVELRSDNPFVYPKIYAGYYTDPERIDVRAGIAGIREAIRIMLSPPFDKYGIRLMERPVFGCRYYEYDSDEYWECALRHLTSTVFHQTTTCKMGPKSDAEAVVDHRLKVHGIRNLRVVDSSIIPISVTGHTNIPSYMVGEKASDIIKEDYFDESVEM